MDSFEQAVQTFDKDVIVVANAGSGKTHLLVEHFFALMASGMDPAQILTFTFTEKAAAELKARIHKNLPKHPAFKELDVETLKQWQKKLKPAPIGTIHQFCFSLLQELNPNSGQLKIIEDALRLQLQEQILNGLLRVQLEQKNPSVLLLLEHYGTARLKKIVREYLKYRIQEGIEAHSQSNHEDLFIQALHQVTNPMIVQFRQDQQQKNWLSFDDLEHQTLALLKKSDPKTKKYLKRFQHVLVDEFQDTSPRQIRIIEAIRGIPLSPEGRGSSPVLFCVGDPKQSIYRFRQVDQNLIHQVEEEILSQGGMRFELADNYRSTLKVLELVNGFSQGAFPQAALSKAKRENQNNTQANLISIDDKEESESVWITNKILELHQSGLPFESMAVLFRASGSVEELTTQLKTYQIPFTLRGGQNLLVRQEIRDLHNLLFFLVNPKDDLALIGILRSPLFLISDASLFFLANHKPKETQYFDYLQSSTATKVLQEHYPQEMEKLKWSLSTLKQMLSQTQSLSPYYFLKNVIDRFEITSLYTQAYQDPDCLLALEQWLDWIHRLEEQQAPLSLNQLVLLLKQLKESPISIPPLANLIGAKNAVSLLTIHAAKGLQFNTVFFMGLTRKAPSMTRWFLAAGNELGIKHVDNNQEPIETPTFKKIKDQQKEEEKEENKRLLYVALSRAENQLFVTIDPEHRRKDSLQTLLLDCLGENSKKFQISSSQAERHTKSLSNVIPAKAEIQSTPTVEIPAYAGMTNSQQTFTVSELETFATCPQKYHFAYVQKISDQTLEFQTEINSTKLGIILHNALNLFSQMPEHKLKSAMTQALAQWDESLPTETKAKLEHTLFKYIESKAYQVIQTAQEDHSELPFLLQLKTGKVRGQMDRLVHNQETWRLIDFKYSQKKLSAEKLSQTYGFQLKTYALAVQHILQGKIPKIEIHLLGELGVHAFEYSEVELKNHQEDLEALLAAIQKKNFGDEKKKEACFSCAYYRTIPVCKIPSLEFKL